MFERESRRFGRGAQLECEQIYAKVFGADHEETLDAAMRPLTVGEEEEDEQGEEGDSDQGEEKRRGKREIAEKENNTVHTHTHTLFTHTHTHTHTHTRAIGCAVESKYKQVGSSE